MAENKKTEGLIYKNQPSAPYRQHHLLRQHGGTSTSLCCRSWTPRRSRTWTWPPRVSVQLQLTDPDLKSRDRMVKKSEKTACTQPWTWAPSGWSGLWPGISERKVSGMTRKFLLAALVILLADLQGSALVVLFTICCVWTAPAISRCWSMAGCCGRRRSAVRSPARVKERKNW